MVHKILVLLLFVPFLIWILNMKFNPNWTKAMWTWPIPTQIQTILVKCEHFISCPAQSYKKRQFFIFFAVLSIGSPVCLVY